MLGLSFSIHKQKIHMLNTPKKLNHLPSTTNPRRSDLAHMRSRVFLVRTVFKDIDGHIWIVGFTLHLEKHM